MASKYLKASNTCYKNGVMLTGTAWGAILPFKEAAASLCLCFLGALRQHWDTRLLLPGTPESPALTCPLWPQPWDGGDTADPVPGLDTGSHGRLLLLQPQPEGLSAPGPRCIAEQLGSTGQARLIRRQKGNKGPVNESGPAGCDGGGSSVLAVLLPCACLVGSGLWQVHGLSSGLGAAPTSQPPCPLPPRLSGSAGPSVTSANPRGQQGHGRTQVRLITETRQRGHQGQGCHRHLQPRAGTGAGANMEPWREPQGGCPGLRGHSGLMVPCTAQHGAHAIQRAMGCSWCSWPGEWDPSSWCLHYVKWFFVPSGRSG